ncbi:MAG TPA: helix-turn-helix transcriptional regulator [Acetobacteraceae bacterium]|nr:helix-turn-helix transcriptional regulator [Acetobacteraceae bacterium]
MPGSGTNRFPDANDYESAAVDIFAEFTLIHRGPFSARASRATLHRLRLLRAEETQARVAYVSLPPDSVFISFSLDAGLSLVWRGLTLQPGEIVFHSRGERLHQRTYGTSCWGLIALSPASLAAFAKTMTGRTLAAPASGQILQPSPRDRRHLMRIHAEAARLADTKPQILGHPEVVRGMEQELGAVLLTCLTESDRRIETDAMRHAADIMIRFEAALAIRPCDRWDLAELCVTVGVSKRTLRRYCAIFLGVAPSEYIQLRRLRLVRAAILRAEHTTTRIRELARVDGFTEPGRFATLYRRTFGETPSATLRRSVSL